MAGLHQARLSYLESVQCAISHPNAWESMTLAILALSRYLSRAPGVQKWLFLGPKLDQHGRPAPG